MLPPLGGRGTVGGVGAIVRRGGGTGAASRVAAWDSTATTISCCCVAVTGCCTGCCCWSRANLNLLTLFTAINLRTCFWINRAASNRIFCTLALDLSASIDAVCCRARWPRKTACIVADALSRRSSFRTASPFLEAKRCCNSGQCILTKNRRATA